jgi:hypothetical protein
LLVAVFAAVSMTALAAAVALAMAVRSRDPKLRQAPVVAAPSRSASFAGVGAEIDLSEPEPVTTNSVPSSVPSLGDVEGLLERDPEAALAGLARVSPATTFEAQRQKLLEVRALVRLRRIGSARTQAGVYYERWPDGPDIAELVRLTGRHPR